MRKTLSSVPTAFPSSVIAREARGQPRRSLFPSPFRDLYILSPHPPRERTKVRVDNKGALPPYNPRKRQTAYGVKKRQEKKTEGEKAPRGKASLGIRGKSSPL